MIFSSLLLTAVGVRVSVFGEGRLCFESNGDFVFASSATLSANAKGLLADPAGHPVVPHVAVAGSRFTISMNGTVTVPGQKSVRLVLRKADGSLGNPGDGSFGLLQVGGGTAALTTDRGSRTVGRPAPASESDTLILISVHPRSTVDNDRVRLSDIADLSGDSRDVRRVGRIDLGDAPLIGNRRSISRWTLQSFLREAGLTDADYKIESFPPDATISRKAQTVEVNDLLDAAMAEARRLTNGAESIPLAGPVVTPVLAPMGDLKIVAKATRNGDKLAVRAAVMVDGHEVGSRNFFFQSKVDGVKVGDALRVAVACGAAAVETDAKAKTAGFVGESIQIVTADGTTLTATVTAAGKAEVKL